MNRFLPIIICLLAISMLAACGAENNGSDNVTTVIADPDGNSHYYEIVTENDTTALFEIETDSDGVPVTNSRGEYVTKKSPADLRSNEQTVTFPAEADTRMDDNTVVFENDSRAPETSADNSQAEKQSDNAPSAAPTEKETIEPVTEEATDSEGWIDRWY